MMWAFSCPGYLATGQSQQPLHRHVEQDVVSQLLGPLAVSAGQQSQECLGACDTCVVLLQVRTK